MIKYYQKISKFVDGTTKLCKDVVTEEDAGIMREDLRRMDQLAKDWQMLFYVDQCSVIHMGIGNKMFIYDIGGVTLRVSEEESDLEAITQSSVKPSTQCVEAAKRIL